MVKLSLPKPQAPPYDIGEWEKEPFAERLRMVCQCWAIHGYGTPWPVYLFYAAKVVALFLLWCLFCSFSSVGDGAGGIGDPLRLPSWWATPVAFQKAVLWSMAFELLGLGCGSGPLTGRYWPPIAAPLYFARPGTIKLPLWPGLPLVGGDRRGLLLVGLYLAQLALLLRALCAPALTPALLLPPVVLLPLLGMADKTLFLAARAEHYFVALFCFLFPGEWVAGCKVLWVAVWWWAATSKLNHHFPGVVAVKQSNSPLTAIGSLRTRLFRAYPHDLRPARAVVWLAHLGTAVEYLFPLALLVGDGGPLTLAALLVMLGFHAFITSAVPMGVPIEWNFMMVYGGLFLFGRQAAVSVLSLHSPLLLAVLLCGCLVLPAVGNLWPAGVSFLLSMRYYAGNWPYSVWLFRGDCSRRLDTHLTKSAPRVTDQLLRFYDRATMTAALSKVIAFRAMHLQGRALQLLLPRAVDDLEAYEYLDGELVAGLVLGWNFGDGHLHQQQLLDSVQRRCAFAPGELRCLFVESQPVGRPGMAYRIVDAASGEVERGEVRVRDLLALQPWPVAGQAEVALQGIVSTTLPTTPPASA
jgi:hypothetical protein